MATARVLSPVGLSMRIVAALRTRGPMHMAKLADSLEQPKAVVQADVEVLLEKGAVAFSNDLVQLVNRPK